MASARGLLVLPMMVVSVVRGYHSSPPSKPMRLLATVEDTVWRLLENVIAPVLDGLAAVGGVFASLEGGGATAVWLSVGSAALAGIYTLPLAYKDFIEEKCSCTRASA